MPTVPVYQPFQVDERQTPQQQALTSVPAGSFGDTREANQARQTAGQVLDEQTQYFLSEKKRADETAVRAAYNQSMEARRRLTYDEKDGFLSKRGKDVLPSLPRESGIRIDPVTEYGQKLTQELDTIEGQLGTKEQREAFATIRLRMDGQFREDVGRHVYAETAKYEEETADALIKNAAEDAVRNPANIMQSKALIESTLQEIGERRGKDPAVIENSKKKTLSSVYTAVIDSKLSMGDDLAAEEVFKVLKESGGFTTEDETKIQKALEVGSRKRVSQEWLDDTAAKGYSYAGGLSQLKKEKDPDTRREKRRLWNEYNMDLKRAKDQDYASNLQLAYDMASENNDVDNISPTVWANLKPKDRKGLESYMGFKRNGVNITTDENVYNKLRDAATNPKTRGIFANDNLQQYRPYLSDYDYQKLLEVQTDLKQDEQKAFKQINQWVKGDKVVEATLSQAGIDTEEEYLQFRTAFDNQVRAFYENSGTYPDSEESQAIMDGLVLEIEKVGKIVDPDVRTFELQEGDTPIITVESIPATTRQLIERGFFERYRRQPKPEEVVDRYVKWLRRQDADAE